MKQSVIRSSFAHVAWVSMASLGFADYDVLLNIENGSRIER